jgi:hypothetical protein
LFTAMSLRSDPLPSNETMVNIERFSVTTVKREILYKAFCTGYCLTLLYCRADLKSVNSFLRRGWYWIQQLSSYFRFKPTGILVLTKRFPWNKTRTCLSPHRMRPQSQFFTKSIFISLLYLYWATEAICTRKLISDFNGSVISGNKKRIRILILDFCSVHCGEDSSSRCMCYLLLTRHTSSSVTARWQPPWAGSGQPFETGSHLSLANNGTLIRHGGSSESSGCCRAWNDDLGRIWKEVFVA